MGKPNSSYRNYIGFNINPDRKKSIIKRADNKKLSISEYCKMAISKFEEQEEKIRVLEEDWEKKENDIIKIVQGDNKSALELKNEILLVLLKKNAQR